MFWAVRISLGKASRKAFLSDATLAASSFGAKDSDHPEGALGASASPSIPEAEGAGAGVCWRELQAARSLER